MFRRGTLLFFVANLIIIGFLLHAFSTLIALLFETSFADAIHPAGIPGPTSDLLRDNSTDVIPRIIHQTYKNSSVPLRWQAGQKSCMDLHEDYTYMLWTDEMSRSFIAKEYPWFLETFDSYPFPIQRADAIRYFVLCYYGGIYIDLDDGCQRRLDPLLSFPAWVRRTVPTGISNDAMGAVPQHPFFLRVIESLQGYNRSWLMPYITVMYSTGPLFLSVIWKEYMSDSLPESERVRILMPDEYSKQAWSFFKISKGNSWHGGDAKIMFWMGQHWMLLTAVGTMTVLTLGGALWWSWRIYTAGDYPRSLILGGRHRRKWGFLRRWNRARKPEYELLDRSS